MHSATKYLNGHSDIIAGALVGARDDEHWAKLRTIRAQLGTILGQTEAWLLMRGMRTLFPRVQWACRSAETLAAEVRRASDGRTRCSIPACRRSPATPSRRSR